SVNREISVYSEYDEFLKLAHNSGPADSISIFSGSAGAGHVRVFVDHLAGAVIPSLLVLATLDIGHMIGMPNNHCIHSVTSGVAIAPRTRENVTRY
ncbi:hypothetical protein O5343_26250, partial [Escherichia coli]|nr:hypothetical protein [Escherichia coli]